MKCAKSVKVKKRASASRVLRHRAVGVPAGELGDDAWRRRPHVVHVQLGLGQARDERGEVGSTAAASVVMAVSVPDAVRSATRPRAARRRNPVARGCRRRVGRAS